MSSDSSADSNDQMCWSFHASLAHVQCKHWPIPIEIRHEVGDARSHCCTLELEVDRHLNLEESSFGIPARGFFMTLMSG